MRERALVHVGGAHRAGKTTFVERMLDLEIFTVDIYSFIAPGLAAATCIRGDGSR